MVQSLNYAYEHGQLNITQKQGIIKVIPTKGKVSHSLKTGGPYSMLITKSPRKL